MDESAPLRAHTERMYDLDDDAIDQLLSDDRFADTMAIYATLTDHAEAISPDVAAAQALDEDADTSAEIISATRSLGRAETAIESALDAVATDILGERPERTAMDDVLEEALPDDADVKEFFN